jgi:hypothetical protein
MLVLVGSASLEEEEEEGSMELLLDLSTSLAAPSTGLSVFNMLDPKGEFTSL